MRFHEIQQGEILIDGISTKDLSRQAVHSLFCMVLQDTWLFEDTVGKTWSTAPPGSVTRPWRKPAKAVGLHHFIRTLPKGYDTILNDQVSLSQGQKQQLTIARAMIADKPMLILDEATSSVDTRTEQKIQAAMDQLMEHRTSFVIAHRLSTHQERRPHPGPAGGGHRGERHPRPAPPAGGLLRRAVQQPVRAGLLTIPLQAGSQTGPRFFRRFGTVSVRFRIDFPLWGMVHSF